MSAAAIAVSQANPGAGYRALREITDQELGDEPALWREWYAAHGAETTERFRQFQKMMEAQP